MSELERENLRLRERDFEEKMNRKRLTEKYNELHASYCSLQDNYTKVKSKFGEAKALVHQWKLYAEEMKKKRNVRMRSPDLPQAFDVTSSAKSAAADNESPLPENATPSSSSSRRSAGAPIGASVAQPPTTTYGQTSELSPSTIGHVIGSSQITEDDNESNQLFATNDAMAEDIDSHFDESPEVLFARPVKRRRTDVGRRQLLDSTNQAGPVHIKQEPLASQQSPPRLRHEPSTRSQGLDLDHDKYTTKTPSKRRFIDRHGGPPDASSLYDEERDEEQSKSSSPSPAVDIIKEEHQPAQSTESNVLKEISPNIRQLPRNSLSTAKDRGHLTTRLAGELAEGYEESSVQSTSHETPKQGKRLNPIEAERRLNSLLETESPYKPNITITRTPAAAKGKGRANTPKSAPAGPSTGFRQPYTPSNPVHSRPAQASSLPRAAQQFQQRPNASSTPQQPLRSRPLERLHASDFRPNPKVNQGLDYAFTEVVRDRDARKCLPGCTRAECCGTIFRAMVDAGVSPTVPRSILESSQDAPDDSDDDRLLRFHLGDAYPNSMTPEYRAEMLAQAKTELLANRIGKHRGAYVRQKTPPGFWNADFPDTQELERNQAKAREQERTVVEEMYREALREDGKWVFRDELRS